MKQQVKIVLFQSKKRRRFSAMRQNILIKMLFCGIMNGTWQINKISRTGRVVYRTVFHGSREYFLSPNFFSNFFSTNSFLEFRRNLAM